MRRWLCVILVLVCMLPTCARGYDWDPVINSHSDKELMELYTALTRHLALKGKMAYIAPTGSKYHIYHDCRNMQHNFYVSVEDAIECGYEECQICRKRKKP